MDIKAFWNDVISQNRDALAKQAILDEINATYHENNGIVGYLQIPLQRN